MLPFIEILTLILLGWVAGAESASWACVHPVINQLPPEQQISFQQGLLKTFGRVMPVLMPLTFILAIGLCVLTDRHAPLTYYLRLGATLALGTTIVTTVLFNVPVNTATGNWDPAALPPDWRAQRARWGFFQGYRAGVLVGTFILLVVAQVYK